MRILIYGINFTPELTGIGKYTGEMAEWLDSRGDDIHIVTAPPYYPEWKIKKGYSPIQYRYEECRGLKIWRSPLWIPVNKNGINRILHLASFTVSSFLSMLKQIQWKPEIIIIIEPSFFCAPGGLLIAKLTGAKTWLHIQDFEIDAALGMEFLSSGNIFKLAKLIERIIMNQFDCISTISNKMLETLKEIIPQKRCALFPNWVDTETIFPITECEYFRKKWGIGKHVRVVLYSGNMGKKQGLETVIQVAAEMISEPDVLFVLCGEGANKKNLEVLSQGMANIRFLPLQPIDRFNLLLNTADIHLLPQKSGAEDLVMPSKLTGILSCGGIVIATTRKNTELANTVLKAGGFITPPDDSKQLVDILKYILKNSTKQNQIRREARKYAETHFKKENILSNFYNTLQSCLYE